MPGMDGTGPYGKGPVTGGGFGRCTKTRGSGGRGCAHMPRRTKCEDVYSEEYIDDAHDSGEIEDLKQRNKELEEKLDDLAAAIAELRGDSPQTS